MNDNLKILVVDDEDSLRMSLVSILELEGYEVMDAENGFKAIELAKQEDFDIMFSDIRMPGMDGTTTFKEIKKIKPDIIGIMMTAYALNDLIVEALNSGAFACLSKPFEIDAALAMIKDIVNRPFAVVVDKDSKAGVTFVNSLKDCGLKVTACNDEKLEFLGKHRPDILILEAASEDGQTLNILNKIIKLIGTLPETILVVNKENQHLISEAKKLGVNNFVDAPLMTAQVFDILGKDKRKLNVALIDDDSEEFANLKKELIEKGFHVIVYSGYEKLLEEIKNTFFDVAIIDAQIETNICDIQDKIKKAFPNAGVIYILNDDVNAQTVKEKGFFYINKPFEIEDVINLINKILGK
mgnify:CR=1 FL=1